MSSNNGLTKTYTAEGTIGAALIVKPGANDYGVLLAGAVSDKLFGVTVADVTNNVTGDRVDVVHEGIADLKLGGTVTRGDLLTSDASGQGVTAAPAAGTNNRIIGMAMISGVSGDIIPVQINPTSLQG